MNCRIEEYKSPFFPHNPLISPLVNFHGKMVTLGSELPKRGRFEEILMRIGYAVLSPLAYLALTFVAFAGLILKGIWESRHVSIKKQENTNVEVKAEQTEIPQCAFGKAEWEAVFPVTLKSVPQLPSNIHEVLDQEDPCEPGKKLKETCRLFLRPEKVILHTTSGDKELLLTFDGMEELAKNATNSDQRTQYVTFEDLRSQMNQTPARQAAWVLMRKQVIAGTRGVDFEEQKVKLKGQFVVPKLMDAILLNILTYASEGDYIYGTKPWTYTRCEEMFGEYQIILGGFASNGLQVFHSSSDFCDEFYGLTGEWKLG